MTRESTLGIPSPPEAIVNVRPQAKEVGDMFIPVVCCCGQVIRASELYCRCGRKKETDNWIDGGA
jgi:hypothetical protein